MSTPTYIIIPCYNESEVIRSTIQPLLEKGYEVVLVDDCSKQAVEEAVSGMPIHYLRHSVNLGQGAALQTGMDYALGQGAEVLVHFDADGQHDVEGIPALIAPIQNGSVEVCMGSRFLRTDDIKEVPFKRRILLQGARVVNFLITGLWLSDAHNGFRALSREAATKIRITENRMAHATEFVGLVKQTGLKHQEIPTKVIYSDYSQAKGQHSLNAINILIDLIINKLS